MLENSLKSDRGRFLLGHLFNCQKCYEEWAKVSNTIPSHKHVAKMEEILHYTHPDSDIV